MKLFIHSDTVLASTTTLLTSRVVASGTMIVGDDINLIATVTLNGGDMTLTAGSTVASASLLADGTSLSDAFYKKIVI